MEMKALKTWRIVLTLLVVLSIVSCNKDLPDGSMSPMEWVLEESVPSYANNYSIPASGCELVFFCKNYCGNVLKVVFKANDTAEQRPLQLTVTAGDIFFEFTFKQLADL